MQKGNNCYAEMQKCYAALGNSGNFEPVQIPKDAKIS